MARLAGIVAALRSVSHASVRTEEAFGATGQRRQQRRLVGVGGFTLAVVTVISTVAAAKALPGDPFYGVKQAAQTASVTVMASEQVRGQRELRIAEARLADIQELLQREDAHAGPAIERALRDVDARTLAGSTALTREYRRSLDIRSLNMLDAFARDQRSRIAALLPALPWPARSRAQESLRLVEDVGDRAVTMLERSCHTDTSCRGTIQAAG
ncbi:MAG: hypothetical protein GEV03_10745 [Streptosporangiales bacterium]|nr:hypothetical protein [Streptosporangiales bacterium]